MVVITNGSSLCSAAMVVGAAVTYGEYVKLEVEGIEELFELFEVGGVSDPPAEDKIEPMSPDESESSPRATVPTDWKCRRISL